MVACIAAVGHDNKGQKPGWHLDLVEVTHLPSGRLYFFACARWLDLAQDDGKAVRVLKVRAPTWASTLVFVCCTASAQFATTIFPQVHTHCNMGPG